jgi:hypothetical protein
MINCFKNNLSQRGLGDIIVVEAPLLSVITPGFGQHGWSKHGPDRLFALGLWAMIIVRLKFKPTTSCLSWFIINLHVKT